MFSLSSKARRVAIGAAGLGVLVGLAGVAAPALAETNLPQSAKEKPTVVLVHGAWADGSSWDKVTTKLQHDGYRVAVPPNPLTGVADDAASLRAYLSTITGPIVLVGHSYAGMVITSAAQGDKQVKALVYVDAYIPDKGDSVQSLTGAKPGSVFAVDPTTVFNFVPIPKAEKGVVNAFVKAEIYGKAFAGKSISAKEVAVLAARQRPLSTAALGEAETGTPAWKSIPSWSVIGKQDAVIPPAEQVVMSKRAKAHTIEIDAPHLSMVTAPTAVTHQIEAAARATD
ncbi:alpha/beta fold hydrolase [Actinoplanes solisilvae]|uniref:alpha/beta fold hydrolase n=1 Tax=Actinoplanes solisilvae TaxID=2486853 RepID=UPI000FD6F7F7|nr:alpha/beta hydrolase [Actinoplanes solisilvae]